MFLMLTSGGGRSLLFASRLYFIIYIHSVVGAIYFVLLINISQFKMEKMSYILKCNCQQNKKLAACLSFPSFYHWRRVCQGYIGSVCVNSYKFMSIKIYSKSFLRRKKNIMYRQNYIWIFSIVFLKYGAHIYVHSSVLQICIICMCELLVFYHV